MKIFLDDVRDYPKGWIKTRFPSVVIYLLENKNVTELSLDHDLGNDDYNGTGYDVLLWIEEKVFTDINFIPPKINIHTSNYGVRKKMEQAVKKINSLYKSKG